MNEVWDGMGCNVIGSKAIKDNEFRVIIQGTMITKGTQVKIV